MKSDREYAVAVDLGGTTLTCAVVDRACSVLCRDTRPTRAKRRCEDILADLGDGIADVIAASGVESGDLAGIGIGCPGIINADKGVVHRASAFPLWRDVPLGQTIADRFGLPALVRHDVDMAALAETRLGAARGRKHVLCITIGTGIGVSFILNGQPYGGARSGAGNLGHMILSHEATPEDCTERGYLEQRAAGPAIGLAGAQALRQGRETALRQLCGGDPEAVDARLVFEAARSGDPVCAGIVADAVHWLGIGIANLVNLLDPEIVIVGGGVPQGGNHFLVSLADTVRAYVCSFLREGVELSPAQLGESAGLIGAGCLVWDTIADGTPPSTRTAAVKE